MTNDTDTAAGMEAYIRAHPEKSVVELAKKYKMTRYRMDAIIKANEVLYHERLTFRKQKEEKLAEAIQAYVKKNPDATMSHILENASEKPIAKQTFLRIIEAYAIEVQETRKVDERVIQQMSAHMEKYPYKTQQEIADDFHLSVSYVGRLIRKHALPYQRKRKKKGSLEASELALCLAKHPEWTHQEIAAYLQVSRETVMKYIKQYHLLYLPKNKKEKKKINRDALHAFVVAHPDLSVLKVAKHFGVSEATMKKRMEKYHIPYRTPRKNGYH